MEDGRQLIGRGLRAADAVHVAAAELLAAEVFLTCDDRLLKQCRRIANELKVKVANPVPWIQKQDHATDPG